jgi:hypothetical protein
VQYLVILPVQEKKMNKINFYNSLAWALTLIVVTLTISLTLIYLNNHPYNFGIEMDDNTLEAVKSINWSALNTEQNINEGFCYLPSSCFSNYSEYLKQFPNNTEPDRFNLCYIYCDGFKEIQINSSCNGMIDKGCILY